MCAAIVDIPYASDNFSDEEWEEFKDCLSFVEQFKDWLNSDRITEEQWLLYYLRQPYPALMLLKFFHVLQAL